MTKEFSVNRLEIKAFAHQNAALEGELPLGQLARLLAEDQRGEAAAAEPVRWVLDGEWVESTGGPGQAWLHLHAETQVQLQCQRCMRPVDVAVESSRSFRFVKDEATAAALDDESEEDVLVLAPQIDALELIEDELLMALPLVPMHERCPEPLAAPVPDEALPSTGQDDKPHPFAALARLKR